MRGGAWRPWPAERRAHVAVLRVCQWGRRRGSRDRALPTRPRARERKRCRPSSRLAEGRGSQERTSESLLVARAGEAEKQTSPRERAPPRCSPKTGRDRARAASTPQAPVTIEQAGGEEKQKRGEQKPPGQAPCESAAYSRGRKADLGRRPDFAARWRGDSGLLGSMGRFVCSTATNTIFQMDRDTRKKC